MQGFVEEQRQGTLERLARASVGVSIVREEGDEITRRAIGRVDALQTHGVFDHLEEEVGDRVCRDNGHESLLSLPIFVRGYRHIRNFFARPRGRLDRAGGLPLAVPSLECSPCVQWVRFAPKSLGFQRLAKLSKGPRRPLTLPGGALRSPPSVGTHPFRVPAIRTQRRGRVAVAGGRPATPSGSAGCIRDGPTGSRRVTKLNRGENQMSNIRPLQDRVIVKRVKEEEKTQGGHHHPRHRQGEADRGRSDRRRQRQDPRGRHASGSST